MASDRYVTDGETRIGIFHFPDRKKPMLGIMQGNSVTAYGSFRSEEAANNFLDRMIEFFGLERKDGGKQDADNSNDL